ncbi:hypothetical protein FQN57_000886 [Myotisia sp. PD_48]|nr:hypothetical protein FQN57_000886 [Myotisia sp. PD_48]
MNSTSLESRVASLAHAHFDALPQRCKPRIHVNGQREWIPFSGIVLLTGENTPKESLTCVSVATGAKCLSASHITQCRGQVLHDCHAEILALRAFNRWVLEEVNSALVHCKEKHIEGSIESSSICEFHIGGNCSGSKFLQWRVAKYGKENSNEEKNLCRQFLEFKKDVKIWMYCSCAPCGDASMELCMAAQEDPTPWELQGEKVSIDIPQNASTQALLNGRAHFSILGVVRRKPARADAESTLSKSCSDKLTVKQVTSILSFPANIFIAATANAYISDFLLPQDELNDVGFERCFGSRETGRMKALKDRVWGSADADNCGGDFRFRPFNARSLPMAEFQGLWEYAKPDGVPFPGRSRPSNISAVWTAPPSYSSVTPFSLEGTECLQAKNSGYPKQKLANMPTGLNETLINGVKQGYRMDSLGMKKASALSRASMWGLLRDIVHNLSSMGEIIFYNEATICRYNLEKSHIASLRDCVLLSPTYETLKNTLTKIEILKKRTEALEDVRYILQNWVQNRGDDDWGLDDI